MRYAFLVLLLLLIAILSYQNKQHHTKINPVSARILHPFDDRIRYRVAEVDSRFGLTKEQVIELSKEAIQIWTLGTGKEFFVYDDDARLSIHLIYDERQHNTEQRKKHIAVIDREQQQWSNKKQEVDDISQDLQRNRQILDAKKLELDQLVANYNQNIAHINRLGGAEPELQKSLHEESQRLQTRMQAMQIEIEQHNFNTSRLNQKVDALNQLNHRIDHSVSDFNQKFQPRLFDKGLFNGRAIYIYEFQSIDDLRVTLAHEFGHALGLKHHDTPEALMYPMLDDQSLENFRLHPADLALLAARP